MMGRPPPPTTIIEINFYWSEVVGRLKNVKKRQPLTTHICSRSKSGPRLLAQGLLLATHAHGLVEALAWGREDCR
jgi:hypothetical protein